MTTGTEFAKYEKKLLEALATADLLKLSKELLKNRVITSNMMKTVASLDHNTLDSKTVARYLLHLVYVKVKVDDTICTKFLTLLSEVDSVRVARIGRALLQLCPPQNPGNTTEMHLVEDHVGYLVEVLAEVSYQWDEISIALGLPNAVIEESRSARTNRLRLHKSLTEWVQASHEHARPPTIAALREALASDIVQQWRLAGEVEDKMKTKLSSAVSLSVRDTPTNDHSFEIQYESTDTEIADSKAALLEVQVTPSESVSYQWKKDGQPLSESSAFSGTHSDMLLISAVGQSTEGKYWCQINDGNEQLTSSPVTLTVKYHMGKKCLLDLYTYLNEIPQDSWPLVSPNAFVELSLIKATKVQNDDHKFNVEGEIEDVLVKREKVEYSEVFGKYERGALVLVEGRPGSGKTTLAHKITKDWAKGSVLQNTQMVFLISLRSERNMSGLFRTFFQSQTKKLQRDIEMSNGKGICFIFDGYDEYSLRHKTKSVINRLIQKTYLPHAMVIVTSRPVATAQLRLLEATSIEILGFTKKQFSLFVDQFPFDRRDQQNADLAKSNLKRYLKACTNVLNMCYLPINACIICFLYKENQGDTLPRTETEIYESLVTAIILRKLRLQNPSAKLHSLKELETGQKKILTKICLLAFDMTIENKQIVNELPLSLESLDKSCFRDLFTIDQTAKLYGLEDTCTFLHLTLQEYLAAYYVAGLKDSKQSEINYIENHMWTMFKFYCGTLVPKSHILQFLEYFIETNPLLMFHCAYEAQEKTLCYRIMELLKGNVLITAGVITPADFTALSYVISTASFLVTGINILPFLHYERFLDDNWKNRELDHTDSLSYSFENTGAVSVSGYKLCLEDLFCTHISYHQKPQYQKSWQKYMELHRTCVTAGNDKWSLISFTSYTALKSVSDIFCSDSALLLANAITRCSNLKSFFFTGNCNSLQSADSLANIMKSCKDLRMVSINSPIPPSSSAALAAGFLNSQKLSFLLLFGPKLCNDGAKVLAKGLSHCDTLKHLFLRDGCISSEGAEALAVGLKGKVLVEIDLTNNNIGDSSALTNLCHCSNLSIPLNNIGSAGAAALAKGILSYTNLVYLDLSRNSIHSNDVIILAKAISVCTSLQKLFLSSNDIGPSGGRCLTQGLKMCHNLQVLTLDNCNLNVDGILALTEGFYCWRQIIFLILSGNGIIADGVVAVIAAGLQYFSNLHTLKLSNSGIDSECAVALAEHLQYCFMLKHLDLSKNKIGSAGAVAIAGGLNRKEINYLDLSHNIIDVKSVEALATLVLSIHFVKPNPSHPEINIPKIFSESAAELKLDLSHNNISSTGALCLITELTSCKHSIYLNLLTNNISSKALNFLSALVQRNQNLSVLLNTSQNSLAL